MNKSRTTLSDQAKKIIHSGLFIRESACCRGRKNWFI
jgi:hypothetical protein